jgi:hypothetical protein
MELNSIIHFIFWFFREITFFYQIQAARLPEKVLIISFATINVSFVFIHFPAQLPPASFFSSQNVPLYNYFLRVTYVHLEAY